MKTSLRILSLFCIVALVAVCSLGNTAMPNKITGELISIAPEVTDEANEAEAASTEVPPHEPVDLSGATLTITHETTNAEGEAETVTLYEGAYQENFENVVQMSEPTEVKIALQVSEESDPMTINAVVGNGSDIHFAYVDRPGLRDEFLLVGSANQVMNPENKFSLSGDLSFLDFDLTNTTSAFAYATFVNADGERQSKQWGPVLVKDNSFLIEGDVDNPLTARLYVNSSSAYFSSTKIILEPRGDIVVSQLGNQTQELSVVSGFGYHAILVESWQQNNEYIALKEAYATEYEQYRQRLEAGEPEPEASDDEDSEVVEDETDTEEDSVELVTAAEGCEDAVAEENDSTQSPYTRTKYYSLQLKATDFRNDTLQEIAEGDDDPMARYLAINMYPYDWNDYASQLAALRPLAKEFDDKFVAAHITPMIEDYEKMSIVVQNDAALIPGQKVPEFALANYDGNEVELYDLLGEKDLVLIDFWASWCGPCIADFPELKKLHAAYTDEDFEIVGVSIDSTMEDWIGGVDEHVLPWINLGEVKGWEGPVSTMYGVNAIPKGFLVDSQGCIYKKNIRPAALKDFLVDRYGMDESLVEPEAETEDTPDVSS